MRKVEQLYRLQELDAEIARCERRLQEAIGRRQRCQQSLAQIRQARQEGERNLLRQERRLHQDEAALQELEARLQGLEKRLYDGSIRSEKQVAALEAEIAQVGQQRAAQEDDVLRRMLELDELRAQVGEMAECEARAAQECEAVVQVAAAEEQDLRRQLGPLRSARAELAAEVPPGTLALYEQLRRSRGGLAVARVVENTCAGCRLEVALLTRKAAAGEDLVRCENCGRILFLP